MLLTIDNANGMLEINISTVPHSIVNNSVVNRLDGIRGYCPVPAVCRASLCRDNEQLTPVISSKYLAFIVTTPPQEMSPKRKQPHNAANYAFSSLAVFSKCNRISILKQEKNWSFSRSIVRIATVICVIDQTYVEYFFLILSKLSILRL